MKTTRRLRRLNHIRRCGLFSVIHPTSVAEHSFHVAIMIMFVCEELKKKGVYVDATGVLKSALLHDVEEMVISDIPHSVKKFIKTGLQQCLASSSDIIDTPDWLFEEIHKDCDDSFGNKIVKACDIAELALYCIDEIELGNTHVDMLFVKEEAIGMLKELNQEIQSDYLEEIVCYGS